jgi:nucleoside-diphosphate-sugar epimerase
MVYMLVGGGGFIGAYTIRRLLEQGHDVVVYDLATLGNSIESILSHQELERVKLVKGDVLDVMNLMHVAKDNAVHKVVHLAGALLPECRDFPARSVQINIDGLNNVFEMARLLGVERVVYISSEGVYGTAAYYGNRPVSEDDPVHPSHVYGACKAFNEFMGQHYFQQFGVDSIGLRFPLVYGPFRLRGAPSSFTLLVELIEKPAIGLPGRVPFGGVFFNFQYVEDTAHAIVLALEREGPTRSRVFNTGGDVRLVDDAVAFVRRLLPGSDLTIEPVNPDARTETPTSNLDTRQVEEELGHRPLFSLEAGLVAAINFFRAKRGLEPVTPPV